MPYHLEKRTRKGKTGWVVVSTDTGKEHSNKPLTHADALAQMAALYIHVSDAKKEAKS